MNFLYKTWRKPPKKKQQKCFLSTVNAWLTAGAWPMSCHYLKKLKGYKVKGRSRTGSGEGKKPLDLWSWKRETLETKGLGNTTAQKKQQFFILSNWLSLHSSIVDAKPVTSFPTGPLSCYLMWCMHSNATWMCVGVCACVSVSNACVLASGLVLSFFSGSVRAHLVFAMGMTTCHCALLLVSVRVRLFPFCEAYSCSFELSATFYFYISRFEFQAPPV